MSDRDASYRRRKAHALWDRARTLARRGMTDEQIAKELGWPLINIQAMTRSVREQRESTYDR